MSGDIPCSEETGIAARLSNRFGRITVRAGCHGKNRADNRHYRTGENPALPPEGATVIFFDFEARFFALDSVGLSCRFSESTGGHDRGRVTGKVQLVAGTGRSGRDFGLGDTR